MKVLCTIALLAMSAIAVDTIVDIYQLTQPIYCRGTVNECPES